MTSCDFLTVPPPAVKLDANDNITTTTTTTPSSLENYVFSLKRPCKKKRSSSTKFQQQQVSEANMQCDLTYQALGPTLPAPLLLPYPSQYQNKAMSISLDPKFLQTYISTRAGQKLLTTSQQPHHQHRSSGGGSPYSRHGEKSSRHPGSSRPSGSSKGKDKQESVPKFRTAFSQCLHQHAPAVPPALLRVLPTPVRKDATAKIKVALRVVRAPNGSPDSAESNEFLSLDPRKKQISLYELSPAARRPPGGKLRVPKLFAFDAVFSPDSSQTEICSSSLVEVIQTVISGADGCFLCLGNDFEGKQQTMIGEHNSSQTLGCIPSAISWLYRAVTELKQKANGTRFSIRVSAIEICGPQETLRDLLSDFSTGGFPTVTSSYAGIQGAQTTGVSLREDPVFGLQLQNVCELRAPTAEKAAFYLDAALAARNNTTNNSPEERRNSHLFFTLHLYQYQVDSTGPGSAVAGGRSKLHLIELGPGERSTKPGRSSLTLPAIGNVLISILQGQKHVPNKDNKLTLLLKDALGSAACKSVSMMACVSTEEEAFVDTTNTVQLAARLCRMKKKRGSKNVAGSSGGGSSDGSSAEERGAAARRFPRSSSEPDCTTSSSEQSCDTVIYLGPSKPVFPSVASRHIPITPTLAAKPPMVPEKQQHPKAEELPVENGSVSQHVSLSANSHLPLRNTKHSGSPGAGKTYMFPPMRSAGLTEEIWVDGPKAKQLPNEGKTPVKTPIAKTPEKPRVAEGGVSNSAYLDPAKREMVLQWITRQEDEQAKLRQPLPHGGGSRDFGAPLASEDGPSTCSGDAMSSQSGVSEVVEMVSIGLQTDDLEIDQQQQQLLAAAGLPAYAPELLDNEYLWTIPEPEVRFLEDIQEEEENMSSGHLSLKDSGHTPRWFEPSCGTATLPSTSKSIGSPSVSESVSHLRSILSREGMLAPATSGTVTSATLGLSSLDWTSKSDSFSLPEQLETISLPGTDDMDELELLTEEELERAMAASMTSLRSHELLERLKMEAPPRVRKAEVVTPSLAIEKQAKPKRRPTDLNGNLDHKANELRLSDLPVPKVRERSADKQVTKPKLEAIIKSDEEGEKPLSVDRATFFSERDLFIPEGSESKHPVGIEIQKGTPKAAAIESPKQKSGLASNFAKLKHKLVSGDHQARSSGSDTDTAKPTKLERLTVPVLSQKLTNEVTSRLLAGQKAQDVHEPAVVLRPKALKEKAIVPCPANGVAANGSLKKHPSNKKADVVLLSTAKTDKKESKLAPKQLAKAKQQLAKPEPIAKPVKQAKTPGSSPLMSFLRSPTRSPAKIANGTTPGNRTSSGYDSGHDSGIAVTSTADSPDVTSSGSPYSKLTKPRRSQRSSSGHGSDNSSAVGSDVSTATPSRTRMSLNLITGGKKQARESVAVSSGYESAGTKDVDTGISPERGAGTGHESSGSEMGSPGRKTPPSCRISRKKFHIPGVGSKSQSAPQSPSSGKKGGNVSAAHRLYDSQVIDKADHRRRDTEMRYGRSRDERINQLKIQQESLKNDLKSAKEKLGVSPDRWSYELHVEKSMHPENPSIVEALEQETRILEKRVLACQNHVMLITVFDAVPAKICA